LNNEDIKKMTRALANVLAMLFLFSGLTATAAAQPADTGGVMDTPSGPLTANDRELLNKVRQAGLWEMPMGELTATKASNARVKQIGKMIMLDHMMLDNLTKKTAAGFGLTTPDVPNPSQQSWMDELNGLEGDAFDQAFVARLRAAHGQVFNFIAKVRTQTRNDVIRGFAQAGIDVVMKHMTLLESTGLAGDSSFAEPQPAGGIINASLASGEAPNMWVILTVTAAGAVLTILLLRVLRPRRPVR
jgi:predicted outer membrane protein